MTEEVTKIKTIAELAAEALALGIAIPAGKRSRNWLREAIAEKRKQQAAYLKEAPTGENLNLFA